jgi:hypothetical protein
VGKPKRVLIGQKVDLDDEIWVESQKVSPLGKQTRKKSKGSKLGTMPLGFFK